VKTSESSKVRVWASITLMVGLYVAALYWVYQAASAASGSAARILPLATSLAVVPCILVVILAIFSIVAKSFRYIARLRAIRITPAILETLALVCVGEGDRDHLRWLAQHHPQTFQLIFTEFLSSFGGEINMQLRILAVELGLVDRWRDAVRSRNLMTQKTALANLGRTGQAIELALLRHPVEQTRIEAACGLLASGSPEAPSMVFKMLPYQSLLGRIRLADSLRPFAAEICERYLADGLRSADPRCVRASVDLLRAWERWIPIDRFWPILAERDIDLRLAAVPALRYASSSDDEAAQNIFGLLQFQDERVNASAAKAASDMGISTSLPLLVNQLRNGGRVSSLAAARALAALGTEGRELLEKEIFTSSRPQNALQALEQSLVAERG
jgi:hypothetical protein